MPHTFVPLNGRQHAALTFRQGSDFSFAAERNEARLVLAEAERAAACFPLVFLPGSLYPHALLGLERENVFVDAAGRWNAPVLPLSISNYPFDLLRVTGEKGASREVLGIDADAPHFRDPQGEALYNADGSPSELLTNISRAFAAQSRSRAKTRAAVAELEREGVIEEKPVTLSLDGRKTTVQGLRFVEEKAVSALPEATRARWETSGVMALLKAHWNSLKHFQRLYEARLAAEPRHIQ